MLGKLFGKKSGQARAAVSKLANRDLMEAVVYGAIYVAAADGDLATGHEGEAFIADVEFRIDHLLLSPQAADGLMGSEIHRFTRGWEKPSDHVPVIARFDLS